ncbi:DUF3263 domain-containing protein [Amnibacterium endophyticum]|uniref:DUF3263 domain-containing protein n=1 Tax=Amnibacterium endophyticum TaxID=2109337 RepID=A0ABW4LDN8_9MICO
MLTHADIRLLEFEDAHPRHTGLKTDAIRMRLGMTTSRYYQRLQVLAARPEVEDRWPRVARRVQRRTQQRADERAQLDRWLR